MIYALCVVFHLFFIEVGPKKDMLHRKKMSDLVALEHAVRNTYQWGSYILEPSRAILLEMVERGDVCMKEMGTESDLIFMATSLLSSVSKGRMVHLGMMRLSVDPQKNSYEEIQTFLEHTWWPQRKRGLFVVNMHLIQDKDHDDLHETSLLLDPERGVLEFWDSEQSNNFYSVIRYLRDQLLPASSLLRKHFSHVEIVPRYKTKAPQHGGAACGFWSLWYIQKRMQGATVTELQQVFDSPTLVKQVKQELLPRMYIVAQALLTCWDEVLGSQHPPLVMNSLETEEEQKNAALLYRLLHDCSERKVTGDMVTQWTALHQNLYNGHMLPQPKRVKKRRVF